MNNKRKEIVPGYIPVPSKDSEEIRKEIADSLNDVEREEFNASMKQFDKDTETLEKVKKLFDINDYPITPMTTSDKLKQLTEVVLKYKRNFLSVFGHDDIKMQYKAMLRIEGKLKTYEMLRTLDWKKEDAEKIVEEDYLIFMDNPIRLVNPNEFGSSKFSDAELADEKEMDERFHQFISEGLKSMLQEQQSKLSALGGFINLLGDIPANK